MFTGKLVHRANPSNPFQFLPELDLETVFEEAGGAEELGGGGGGGSPEKTSSSPSRYARISKGQRYPQDPVGGASGSSVCWETDLDEIKVVADDAVVQEAKEEDSALILTSSAVEYSAGRGRVASLLHLDEATCLQSYLDPPESSSRDPLLSKIVPLSPELGQQGATAKAARRWLSRRGDKGQRSETVQLTSERSTVKSGNTTTLASTNLAESARIRATTTSSSFKSKLALMMYNEDDEEEKLRERVAII